MSKEYITNQSEEKIYPRYFLHLHSWILVINKMHQWINEWKKWEKNKMTEWLHHKHHFLVMVDKKQTKSLW